MYQVSEITFKNVSCNLCIRIVQYVKCKRGCWKMFPCSTELESELKSFKTLPLALLACYNVVCILWIWLHNLCHHNVHSICTYTVMCVLYTGHCHQSRCHHMLTHFSHLALHGPLRSNHCTTCCCLTLVWSWSGRRPMCHPPGWILILLYMC